MCRPTGCPGTHRRTALPGGPRGKQARCRRKCSASGGAGDGKARESGATRGRSFADLGPGSLRLPAEIRTVGCAHSAKDVPYRSDPLRFVTNFDVVARRLSTGASPELRVSAPRRCRHGDHWNSHPGSLFLRRPLASMGAARRRPGRTCCARRENNLRDGAGSVAPRRHVRRPPLRWAARMRGLS